MAADVSFLTSQARCYDCYGATLAQGMKLVILKETLLKLDPMAATDPQSLMAYGKCFACEGVSAADVMELALLDQIRAASGGGSGSTPNLSQVLTQGNDAGNLEMLNINSIAVGTAAMTDPNSLITVNSMSGGLDYRDDTGKFVIGSNSPSASEARLSIYGAGANGQPGVYYEEQNNGFAFLTYVGVGGGNSWGIYSYTLAADVFVFDAGAGGKVGIMTPLPAFTLDVAGDGHFTGDLNVDGKINLVGVVDPPSVLFDEQSRDNIKAMVLKQVPKDKQAGAAMFFNKDTHRIEVYVASENVYYDLNGQPLT